MKKIITKKTLRFDVETVRSLETNELEHVAGGALGHTKNPYEATCVNTVCFYSPWGW